VKLGKVTYVAEGSSGSAYPISQRVAFDMAEGMAVGTSISPGETEISLTVQVAYSILD